MWHFTHLMWFKARNVDLWGYKGKKLCDVWAKAQYPAFERD